MKLISIGVLTTPAKTPLPMRLAELKADLAKLMDDVNPDVVAVEHVFFQVNVRTAMSVGQASGLALAEAASRGCEVVLHTERSEVSGRRLGRGRQDTGGPHGAGPSRPGRPTETG